MGGEALRGYAELKRYELVYSNNIEENEIRSKEAIRQLPMIDGGTLKGGDRALWTITK
jgi:hypothetical protein